MKSIFSKTFICTLLLFVICQGQVKAQDHKNGMALAGIEMHGQTEILSTQTNNYWQLDNPSNRTGRTTRQACSFVSVLSLEKP